MTQVSEERVRWLPFAFSHLDPSVSREVTWLDATDTAQSFGILYRPPGRQPKTVVYLMHPRGEFTRHYVVPGLTARGYAVFGHNSRYLNNDTDMVHERLLFDIAAGLRWLKEQGFERIVLLGNSGGGSLLGFYQSQSERTPAERLTRTPGGEALDLSNEVMPAGDLYIAVAAHLGEGRFMLNVLDPSVTNEMDPNSYDPDWDIYNPANGYRGWPVCVERSVFSAGSRGCRYGAVRNKEGVLLSGHRQHGRRARQRKGRRRQWYPPDPRRRSGYDTRLHVR